MRFVDPQAPPAQAAEPYTLSTSLAEQPVIGLMANGYPDSVTFLTHVEKSLAALLPGASFEYFDKGNASKLADVEMLDAAADRCTAVIAAYGH